MGFNSNKTLRIRWHKTEGWMIDYPSKPTGHMTSGFIDGRIGFDAFIKELSGRGYDTTTLRLSVHRRSFTCIQARDSLVLGETYFMKANDDERVQLVDSDGYAFTFSSKAVHATQELPYLNDYFTENK